MGGGHTLRLEPAAGVSHAGGVKDAQLETYQQGAAAPVHWLTCSASGFAAAARTWHQLDKRYPLIRLRDLERHLQRHGCELLRQGGRHAIWWNPVSQRRSSVPRHREIPVTTAKAICAQLGVDSI
ncbi:type II toxin-antitoxin system HicA family toxin [Jatrophihabitans sp.]|uniref:type II toxin-antitoxin system HicA family toxin n=1 Tax=Jatrophihabitans sp. TaxID=1932789 RepID=UPI0038CD6870